MAVNRKLAELTSAVYFIQGALSLSGVAFPLFLRQSGFQIKDITVLTSFAAMPWALKPFYAAISDSKPIWNYRRKTYIMIFSVLSMLGWWGLALSPARAAFIVWWMLLANLGFAVTDVVTDGLIVEHSTKTTTQTYQSLSWGFRSLGAIAGGIIGGWLTATAGHRIVFALTGFLPIISLVISFKLEEKQYKATGRPIMAPLIESCRLVLRGDLLWFSLLLLTGTVSACYSVPLFFYFKENLGFVETLLGALTSLSWIGAIIGCLIYYRFLKKMSLKRTLTIAITIDVLSTLLCLLIFNRTSAILLCLLTGTMAYISLLPLMAVAAELAHGSGIESTLFSILMSIRNLGMIIATNVGGQAREFVGLRPLILISALFAATGLLIVRKLKRVPA